MTNRNARIVSRVTRNNKLRTETKGRNDGPEMSVSTDGNNKTRLFIDLDGIRDFGGSRTDRTVELDGHQARTLFRLLAQHYDYTGKGLMPVVASTQIV